VTFICKNRGILSGDCDKGRFEWHFVKCACPAGSTAIGIGECVKNNFVTAKDVQCSTPTTPPSPSPSKPYIFKYEVKDFEFEPPLNNIGTKKVSSISNGIISNCADRVTTDHEVKMSIAIGNSQSMTVSKSFTSSTTNEYAAGVSVRAKAEASVMFVTASVEAEARFDYSHSLEESETEEDSTTMETSSEIEFDLATTVSVAPNTCVKYDYWTQVSSEPLAVPYKAKTYLTILRNDENQEQVTDLDTLKAFKKMCSVNTIQPLTRHFASYIQSTVFFRVFMQQKLSQQPVIVMYVVVILLFLAQRLILRALSLPHRLIHLHL